jgi:DNA-binding response OmpR family regulator
VEVQPTFRVGRHPADKPFEGRSVSEVREQARIVLCEDDPVLRQWVARRAASAGVEVVGVTDHWPTAMELVVEHEVHALVVDIATVGRVGLRLVPAMRQLAPWCEVMVITPLDSVDLAALEAGASVVCGPSDLRPLAAALVALGVREPQSAV